MSNSDSPPDTPHEKSKLTMDMNIDDNNAIGGAYPPSANSLNSPPSLFSP